MLLSVLQVRLNLLNLKLTKLSLLDLLKPLKFVMREGHIVEKFLEYSIS